MAELGPITLTGSSIRLEPMRSEHAGALLEAGRSTEVWEWMPARPTSVQSMERWLARAVEAEAQGREYPFIVRQRSDGRIIGSTRYLDVQEEDRTAEIGWTWYAPAAWGTVVNPEAKYLLLRHAFEDWRAIRVALKTDIRNLRSQAAIKSSGRCTRAPSATSGFARTAPFATRCSIRSSTANGRRSKLPWRRACRCRLGAERRRVAS